jgi:hypothetical protein
VGFLPINKKPPDCGRAVLSLLPGVLIFISHDPDQSNHKGSLLRKKEDYNQANDYLEQVNKIHFGLPFLKSIAKSGKNKKAARLGGLLYPELV